MAGCAANNQKMNSRGLKENDMLMGALLSQKSSIDLMQNCDLPPPLKVFSGSDKMVISSMNRAFRMMGQEEDTEDFEVHRGGGGENEKLELLKALRLSKTRARETERKVASLAKERDCLSNALLHESLHLFAYRQWMRLLEVQVWRSKAQWEQEVEGELCCRYKKSIGVKDELLKEGKDCEEGGGTSWIVALALCLGMVGFGVAFGCCYFV